jgi:serine/threonine-protein kinase
MTPKNAAACDAEEDVAPQRRRVPLTVIPITPYGKYTLVGKLGHGGMAEVFLAYMAGPAGFRKLCVIKRLHPNLEEEPGFVDMFLDEARLAARLNHPNVVQTYEVGDVEGSHFIAMEYLEGQGLDRVRQRCHRERKPFPYPVAARIIAEALGGLHYAHELKDFDGTPLSVIHRDISPQNVFLTYEGAVKLLDFGIAKAATHVVETRTGVIKGKFAYIAPEQARSGGIDRRADLWSMGVVLWEVLAGQRLFKGPNDVATLNESLTKSIPKLSGILPDVPPMLEAICEKALTRDRERRYQTAREMRNDLRKYIVAEESHSSPDDVAALVNDLFGDVIQQTRRVLKGCLSDAKSERGLTTDEYRFLIGGHGTGEISTPSGVHETNPSISMEVNLSGLGPHSSPVPPPLGSMTPLGFESTPSGPGGSAVTPSGPTGSPTRRRTILLAAIVGVLVLLATAGVGIGWVLSHDTGQAPAVTPDPSANTPGPTQPPRTKLAVVSLTSDPTGAEVLFGGEVLGRTPLQRELDQLPPGAEAAFLFRLAGMREVVVTSPLREERVTVHADLRPTGGTSGPGTDDSAGGASPPEQAPPSPQWVVKRPIHRPPHPPRPGVEPPAEGDPAGHGPEQPRPPDGQSEPPTEPERPGVIVDEGQHSVPIID